jgi:hypothetical protein
MRVQLEHAEANYQAEVKRREAAEKDLSYAFEQLLLIAQALASEEMDSAVRERGLELRNWKVGEISHFIIEAASRRLQRLQLLARGDLAERVQSAELELEGLRSQVAELTDRLAGAEAREAGLRRDLDGASQRVQALLNQVRGKDLELTQLRRERTSSSAPAGATDVQGPDGPGVAAHSEGELDRSLAALLQVLAFQGICRRKEIEGVLARDHQMSQGSGTVQRAFDRAMEKGLIEAVRPKAEISGRSTMLVWLSEAGRAEARRLFSAEPAESEYAKLISRHKSPEHVLLNLEVRDALLERGASSVNLFPSPTVLPEGGVVDVDLIAEWGGKTLYVECERETRKSPADRDRKWGNYAKVARDFYVICPDRRAQEALVSEITGWQMATRYSVKVHVTNLADVAGGEGNFWRYVR